MQEYISKERFEKEILILNEKVDLQKIEINSIKKQLKWVTDILQFITKEYANTSKSK